MYSVIGVFWDVLRTLILVGVIIFVHELGHFLAAKKQGIRVEKFSIGFGPRMVGFTRGETEYQISWLPFFGGYVKMLGENPAERPDEDAAEVEVEESGRFDKAPVSKRAIVALAGPGMNILFAVFAVALAYMIGLQPNPGTTVGYVESDSPASKAGIMRGDKILSVAGYKANTWDDLRENVGINADKEIDIVLQRNASEEMKLKVVPERILGFAFSIESALQGDLDEKRASEGLIQEFENNGVSLSPDAFIVVGKADSKWIVVNEDDRYIVRKEADKLNVYKETEFGMIGVSPVIAPAIGGVELGSPAYKAGFRPDDIIEKIDNKKVDHIIDFVDEIQNVSSKSVMLTIKRSTGTVEIPLALDLDENGQLAFLNGLSFGKVDRMNPIAAFGKAIPETIQMGGKIFQFLKRMIIREVPMKFIAGPVGIIQITMAVVKTGLADTLRFSGFLSVNLGIVNLLPLFITDGAMVVFLIIEKLRGRPMSHKRQLFVQQVGVGFIIFLFLLITYNDVLRLVRGFI